MGQNGCPRGAPQIVPAVPRKFERPSTKQSANRDEPSRPSSQGKSDTLQHSPSQHLQNCAAKSHTATSPNTQDFGIEKYGRLPPPFYPANPSPIPSKHGFPLPDPGYDAEEGISSATSGPHECPQWTNSDSAYAGNPTPPHDDSPAPFHYSVNAQTFHPQPTPPSDMTPSPTQSSYQRMPYPYNISFYPPQTPEFVDSPSSAESLYQGYSYAPPLMNLNFYAPPYSPDDYINSAEASVEMTSNVEQDAAISEHNGFAPIPQNGEIDWSTQSEAPATIDSRGTSDPDYQDLSNKQALSQTSSEAQDGPTKSNEMIGGDSRSFSDPISIDRGQDEPEGHGLRPKTSPGEPYLWQQMSNLPPFFLQHFNNPKYADCRLSISFKNQSYESFDLLLHRVILAYSPFMAALLESSESASDGLRLSSLDVTDKYITPQAIEFAISTCYIQAPDEFHWTAYKSSGPGAQEPATSMDNNLAILAAGQLFGLPDVVARGSSMAVRELSADTIEQALSFALQAFAKGDLESSEYVSAFLRGGPSGARRDRSSIDHQMKPDNDSPNARPTNRQTDDGRPWVENIFLFLRCLEWIVRHYPDDCSVDTSAQSLASIDRLPQLPQIPQNGPKSRLSRIQFGSLSSEKDEEAPRSTPENMTLSSILLSLPFGLLEHIVSKLQQRMSAESFKALIDERERRRRRVLQEHPGYNQTNTPLGKDDPVGWEEYLDTETTTEDEGVPYRIAKRWVGTELTSNA